MRDKSRKRGARLLGDHVIRPAPQVFVCDFPRKLSDLDHFDLPPVGREFCFFFDGVSLPEAGSRELAQNWQVVIPTRGQTGSFATTGAHPAHLQIAVLPGRNSLSAGSRQLSGAVHRRVHWTYGSQGRDLDSYTTIGCAITGLTAPMLKAEIEPLDADNNPLDTRRSLGRSGTVVYGAFRVPAQRMGAVRVTLSWNAKQGISLVYSWGEHSRGCNYMTLRYNEDRSLRV